MKTEAPAGTKEDPKTLQSAATALRFEVREDSKELVAVLASNHESTELDLISVRKMLSQEDLSGVEIEDAALVDILRRLRRGEAGEAVLGVIESGLSFSLDYEPDSGILFAVLEPSNRPPLTSTAELEEHIKQADFDHFKITSVDLTAILIKIKQNQAGRYAIGKRPEYTLITFYVDDDSNKLLAKLVSCDEATDLSVDAVKAQLTTTGFGSFFIEQNTLNKICEQAQKNVRGEFVLGERRDAAVSISFDEELMTAFISTQPPAGGKSLTLELLEQALAEAEIHREFCDQAVLMQAINEPETKNLPFARGIAPSDGQDASFEALVEEVQYSTPKESKTGKIDLREIVNFTLIEENTPLMRRTPAETGVNGRNVKGEIILANEVLDTPFEENLSGVEVSTEDPNLLVSVCKGHPVILAHGVKVDNVITVNNVDMSTGNLSYDGSVLVKGEVRAGMRVSVTGDIVVKGVVTKAYLRAKNNITIECGVIGSDPAKDGEQSPPAIIKAGGDVSAQYFHLADIHAGRNLYVREYASHCTVDAKHQILAGQTGGKGRIFGGKTYARRGIYANALGASGETKTPIYAGYPPEQQKQFEHLLSSYEGRIQQQNKLKAMLKKYQTIVLQNPTEIKIAQKTVTIKSALKELKLETEKMASAIKKINATFKESRKAEVSVRDEIFANVSISINSASFHVRQQSKGGIFVKSGSDIRWMNYRKK